MVFCVFFVVFASFCRFSLAFLRFSSLDCICLLISPMVSLASPCIVPLLAFDFLLSLAYPCFSLLSLASLCFPLLALVCLLRRRAERAPLDLLSLYFSALPLVSLAFSYVPSLSRAFSCSASMFSWHLSFNWFPWRSLALPCFPLLSLPCSRFLFLYLVLTS